jgi:hypothetical protein
MAGAWESPSRLCGQIVLVCQRGQIAANSSVPCPRLKRERRFTDKISTYLLPGKIAKQYR